ncbi:hypothetical protein BDZ97DRAFT_658718 [Flammula alnicola]|nr:hypothetical protein BDZ97DRAFT_658718 [Flammula alnicola]
MTASRFSAFWQSFQQNRDDLRKILSVQSTLSCLVREGMWKPSLRTERPWPSFTPKEECSIRSKLGSSASTRNSSLNICQLLSGKKILFVGPETTFYLHSLWLDSLETRERRSYTCLGQEFCTFHHICRPPAAEIDDSGEISGRKKKMPSKNLLLTTRSSLLQYTHSTTLYASQNKHDEGYTAAVVDEQSNVRVPNAYWLRRARKAGIVVMNRGPLPAPGSTYNFANGLVGNWTFTKTLCADNNYLDPLGCDATLGSRLVNAALSATTDRFLPSLLLSLQAISKDFEIARSLLVWQGSWYIQPLCAKAGLPGTIPLLRDIWSDSEGALIDPWSIYYNSQGENLLSLSLLVVE